MNSFCSFPLFFFSSMIIYYFNGGKINYNKNSDFGCIIYIIKSLLFFITMLILFIIDIITYPLQLIIKYTCYRFFQKKESVSDICNSV